MGNPKQAPGGVTGIVQNATAVGQAILTAALNRVQIMNLLAAYEQEPAGASTAARDLDDQAAFDLVMHLAFKGDILLNETITIGTDRKVVRPKPGQQLRVRTTIAGFDYKHASNPAIVQFLPKPSLVIALYRLAKSLSEGYYRATNLVWGGIGHGDPKKAANCHEVGTCVDVYSVLTRFGKMDVYKDWGIRPVYAPNGTRLTAVNGDPWGNATTTYYRLRSSDAGMPFYFFHELYKVAREQFSAGATDNLELREGQNIRPGANIFHPDYPGIALRRTHQEHIHFQIGPSFL